MVANLRLFLILLVGGVVLPACGGSHTQSEPWQIALLAPFEGRYREVGYEAYYSAQLALDDFSSGRVKLLAIDDGGSSESAMVRASALQENSRVLAVIVLGFPATEPNVISQFTDLSVLVIGEWGVQTNSDHVFTLSPKVNSLDVNVPPRVEITELGRISGDVVGREALSLKEFALLRQDLTKVSLLSPARLPDDEYARRIQEEFPFADSPGLYSTLTYDAVGLLVQSVELDGNTSNRSDVMNAIREADYDGINGRIRFVGGFWLDAPLYQYAYNRYSQLYLVP